MPYMSDADYRKAMHQFGLTKSGAARKPKQARRKYAARRATPSPASVQAIRKVSGEKKGVDTGVSLNGVGLSTTNSNVDIIPVNLVAAGAGSFNRVGRKIFCKSLRIMAIAEYQQAPIATTVNFEPATLRMVVVWDKQPSGTIPTWETIFSYKTQGGTETGTTMGPPSFDNMSRFQVLRDIKIVANPNFNASGGTENRVQTQFWIDEYIKLGNRQTVYSGDSTTMTIADVSSGALYVGWRVSNAIATTAQWQVGEGGDDGASIARLRYSD